MTIKNCNVIICGPAIGKTYLAKHDLRFIDLDGEKAKYKYNLYNNTDKDLENGKLNRGKIINNDSTAWAINRLEKEIKNNKIILLSYNDKIIEYIINNNIKYCLVYAKKELRLEYIKRMKKRGNCKKFIDQVANEKSWNEFYEKNMSDDKANYKIELKSNMYLSDIKNYFINK